MEKEVKVALITGFVAVLVGALQYGSTYYELFSNSQGPGNNSTSLNASLPIINLDSDKKSPQPAGIVIMWTASTHDSDDSTLHYQFLLSGPKTGNNFVIVQDWDSENTWTWTTTDADIGKNKVKIRVRDRNQLEAEMTKNYTIIVDKPKALFTYFQYSPESPVEFDASQSRAKNGTIIDYEWNFGDGKTYSSGDKSYTTHDYKKGGVYNVKLTVANDKGETDSFPLNVNVTSKTSYQIKVKTKDVDNAGSDTISVYLTLNGTLNGKYREVETKILDNKYKNDFEQNATDEFNSGMLLDVGDIIKITLEVSFAKKAKKDTWLPESISITNNETKESWTFDISNVVVNDTKTYGPYYPNPK